MTQSLHSLTINTCYFIYLYSFSYVFWEKGFIFFFLEPFESKLQTS